MTARNNCASVSVSFRKREREGMKKAINTALERKATIKLGLFLVGSTTINNVLQKKGSDMDN